jgi:hypothetical protein
MKLFVILLCFSGYAFGQSVKFTKIDKGIEAFYNAQEKLIEIHSDFVISHYDFYKGERIKTSTNYNYRSLGIKTTRLKPGSYQFVLFESDREKKVKFVIEEKEKESSLTHL